MSPFGTNRMTAVGLSIAVLLLVVGGPLAGCTSSSRAPEQVAADRSEVLGVWRYNTNGTSVLQDGTLQIHVQDGKLKGRIKDRWRGTVTANVLIEGSHMELNLNQVRISGKIRQNRFEAAVRQSFWDASEQGNRRSQPGYFVAQRVRRAEASSDDRDVGCPSLLREHSFTCSPLFSQ